MNQILIDIGKPFAVVITLFNLLKILRVSGVYKVVNIFRKTFATVAGTDLVIAITNARVSADAIY